MTAHEAERTWEQRLRASLDDRRLSRGERKALGSHLEEAPLDARGRDVVRAIAFDLAQEVIDSTNTTDVLAWLEDITRLLVKRARREPGSIDRPEAWFSPGDDCRRSILGELRQARQAVDVCVFTITDDTIYRGLAETIGRGLRLRVMTDDDKTADPGSDIARLAAGGAEVRVDRSPTHMHHKFALFDDRRLLTGSYNWTRSAARGNSENLLVTADKGLIRSYRQEFEHLWQGGETL